MSHPPRLPAPFRLRALASDLFVVDGPQRFLGVELGGRTTVVRIGTDLLLHSPMDLDPALLAPLGTPRWLLAPNKFHHLYVGPWQARGLEAYAAPGLPE